MYGAPVRSRRKSGRFVRFFLFWSSGLEDPADGQALEWEGSLRIYRDIPEELRALIEPVVDEHDCELVDVEVVRNRGTGLLRITVDNPNGDGRVAIERCVAISREIETLLDAADSIPGAYQLEVSSPGLDRVLGREKDFLAAIDQEVKLRTRRPIEGRKRYRGRLVSLESGVLKMKVEGLRKVSGVGGDEVLIPIEEVEKANLIYEFTSADFAKESSRRGSSQSGGV
jgi:ribosome maturation factor RimP